MPEQDQELRGIVQRMIDAGEPEEAIGSVIKRYGELHATAAPPQLEPRIGGDPYNPWASGVKWALRTVKEHPVQAGAMAGGLAASPFTGGMSLLPGALATGAASAVGAGVGEAATGHVPSLKTMGTEGVLGMVGEGLGRGAMQGARLLARGAYRVALAPTKALLNKYGDIVGHGLETATPVSEAGLAKAAAAKTTAQATKKAALSEADQRAMLSANLVADDAAKPLAKYSTKQARAGLPDPSQDFAERLGQFKATNPNGSLTPSAADEIKGTLDDVSGGAYRKIRNREPITSTEKGNIELAQAISRAEESVTPEYRKLNRNVMDATGLGRSIYRRTKGEGGNQVLDTLLMAIRGKAGIPGRIAMMPPVLSNAAIKTYAASPALPSLVRSALLALLSPHTPQDQEQ